MPGLKYGKPVKPTKPAKPAPPVEADDSLSGKPADVAKREAERQAEKMSGNKAERERESESVDNQKREEEQQPDPTATAKWEKSEVVPLHNNAFPPASPPTDSTVPDDAKCKMIVETEHVPDGTSATITVSHVDGSSVEDGTVSGLEVRGNKVVDPATGAEPVWVFEAKHKPWDEWDCPFFRFEASIDFKGLTADTPKDYKGKKDECLRVLYWHYFLAPRSGLSGTQREGSQLQGKLTDGGIHSKATFTGQGVSSDSDAFNLFGSAMRNTYCFHIGCHGNVSRRGDGMLPTAFIYEEFDDPADFKNHGSKGRLPKPKSDWRGSICYGPTRTVRFVDFETKANLQYVNHELGDNEFDNDADFPSVPRYLLYVSCCLVGWDSSTGNAICDRGCQNVIAFRKTIDDNTAVTKANEFFDEWKKVDLNPHKIPPIFFDVFADVYTDMRPALFGRSSGAISSSGFINGLKRVGAQFTSGVFQIADALF